MVTKRNVLISNEKDQQFLLDLQLCKVNFNRPRPGSVTLFHPLILSTVCTFAPFTLQHHASNIHLVTQGSISQGDLKVSSHICYLRSNYVMCSFGHVGNHRGISTNLGFEVKEYRYWDQNNRCLDFEGFCQDLRVLITSFLEV